MDWQMEVIWNIGKDDQEIWDTAVYICVCVCAYEYIIGWMLQRESYVITFW